MDSSQDDKRIQVTREYFRLADQGRREVLEQFHDEAEIYFPKFGFGFGRESLFEMVKGFDGVLDFIQHDYDKLTFIRAGDYVVVEGTSRGRLSGKAWAGGETPGGRFCNVFKFRGDAFRVSMSILIPTTPVRTSRGFGGVWIANGEVHGSARRPEAQLFRMAL